MKHDVEITSADGVNVYINLKVKAKPAGKIIMGIIMILLVGLWIVLLLNIDPYEMGKALFPLLIVTAAIIWGPARYLCWNLFGEERILINTKVICWQYSYGIIETKMKQVPFRMLGTGFNIGKMFDGTEHGTLVFYDYPEKHNIPQVIFETTVLLPKPKLEEIHNAIKTVFYNEFLNDNKFVPFSLN
jgi:hypothetical protein